MAHVLTEGEKVYYDRDYYKKRNRSANITITNKRLISSVEGKKELTHKEYRLEDITGVETKLSWFSKLIVFVAFYLMIGGLVEIILNFVAGPSVIYLAMGIPLLVVGGVSFIICLLRLRNGYYILVKTKVSDYCHISLSADLGAYKPIKIKPKKEDALDIMNTFPAALISIKRECQLSNDK